MPIPPADEPAHALDAVRAFHFVQLRSTQVISRAATALGISAVDLRVMYFLSISTDATPTHIAEHMGLTTGSVTTLLDRLAAAGFAERTPHAVDRRRTIIVLTPLGLSAVAEVTQLYNEAFLGAISAEQVAELTIALTALSSSLANVGQTPTT
jgi:DNA-binding MarR family transcriptional regulator